jgi:hypothetical protein
MNEEKLIQESEKKQTNIQKHIREIEEKVRGYLELEENQEIPEMTEEEKQIYFYLKGVTK